MIRPLPKPPYPALRTQRFLVPAHLIAPTAADIPFQSSGAVFTSAHLMSRPAFPVAPHEFFLRLPVAPHEMLKAPANEELLLSDLEHIGDLGSGASGVVTMVRHRRTGAKFALKTVHYPDRDSDNQEAKALRRSDGSPHVVRWHAVLGSPDEDQLAYVLELMDAGTLAGVLSKRGGRGLSEPVLAEVVARCLEGLAHLHSRGVAHLDLNLSNVLVNSQGDVKIGDFSESKIFYDDDGKGRRVSIAVGMTAFKSPERFVPNAHAGPRGAVAADVWAFGVTILHLFLGRRPFVPSLKHAPYDKLRAAICDAEPPSVPESLAASTELRGFVAACLQKDPRRRATASQLLAHPFITRRHVEESRRALREVIVESLEK